MPNYYSTKVRVKGVHNELAQFVKTHFNISTLEDDRGNEFFDFNTVIPRPACIEGTERSDTVKDGIEAFDKGSEVFEEWIEKHDQDELAKVKLSLEARKQTGFTDWPPTPVFYRLIMQYPSLSFDFVGRDEFETKWECLSTTKEAEEAYNKGAEDRNNFVIRTQSASAHAHIKKRIGNAQNGQKATAVTDTK